MLLCFDYDGVLVDSFDVLLSMAQRAQQRIGRGRLPTADDFRLIDSLTFTDLARRIGLAGADVDRFGTALFALQADRDGVEPFPGVVSMLRRLALGHDLAVVTASHGDVVWRALGRFKVRDAVGMVLGGEGGRDKAERIAEALARTGAEPRDALMVGDAVSDIREGCRAGVATVAVTWGYQDRVRLAAEAPDYIVDSPDDLVRLVQSIDSRG